MAKGLQFRLLPFLICCEVNCSSMLKNNTEAMVSQKLWYRLALPFIKFNDAGERFISNSALEQV